MMALELTKLFTLVYVMVVASALVPPDTSLDTVPVGYFGGVNCKERSQENIEMLAKMRLIVIEKWEGPCWYDCYDNLTKTPPVPCQPSCGAENYQMNTIKRAKTANPKLAAVFYLNTLYDFPFLELHGEIQKAKADVVDVNGTVVAFKNDNGMPNINVFDHGKQIARDLWTGLVKNLSDSGYVDGIFDDKHQINATWNKTSSFWQLCEWPEGGRETWNISCGIISEETAKNYNLGKPKILDMLFETFGPSGIIYFNTTGTMHLTDTVSPIEFAERLKTTLDTYKYVWIMTTDLIDGDCTSTKSSCSDQVVAIFLLSLEKGAFLGCNGWDGQFGKPLGDPLGPAARNGDQLERHFKSGTYVTWDLKMKSGKIFWSNSTTV